MEVGFKLYGFKVGMERNVLPQQGALRDETKTTAGETTSSLFLR